MEQEIVKHGIKAYNEVKNPAHNFWVKAKEIFIEILIIVFAVTISIWLHGWAEHKEQQKEAKEFLADLKDDLQHDINSMRATKDSITKKNKEYYNFLEGKGTSFIFSTAIVTTKISNGDYEGFKSSGKIGFIENKELKKAILKYYQETTPSVLELEKANTDEILKIIHYVIDNLKADNGHSFFKDMKLKLMLKFYLDETESIKSNYDDAIQQASFIIGKINSL